MFDQPQMADLPAEKQAAKAIAHTLSRVSEVPAIGYFIGWGSQAYSLLTEAHATLSGITIAEAQENYPPASADVEGDLRPCAFCRERSLSIRKFAARLVRYRFDPVAVVCNECKARGPLSESKEDARRRWNDRPYV